MPGAGTVIAAALVGAVTLGTLAGTTIPAGLKASSAPDWRETYGAAPRMDGQDYYVEPSPQDLSPPPVIPSWRDTYEPGAGLSYAPYAPYAYDSAAPDDDTLAVPASEPLADDVPSPDDQAAAAEQVAEAVEQAEAQAPSDPVI